MVKRFFFRLQHKLVNFFLSKQFVIKSVGRFQVEKVRNSNQPQVNVWLGDSHASFLSEIPIKKVFAPKRSDALIWLGPRLMFSIAKNGFPNFLYKSRYKNLLGETGNLLISFGEIDIRVHLSREMNNDFKFEWVDLYIEEVSKLNNFWNPKNLFVLGPVPPSDFDADYLFPVEQPISLRLEGIRCLNSRLEKIISTQANIHFVSLTRVLGDEEGLLLKEFHLDGIHTAGAARLEVEKYICLLG
jgi:hypothetical protein